MKNKWITWLVLLSLAVGVLPPGSVVGQFTSPRRLNIIEQNREVIISVIDNNQDIEIARISDEFLVLPIFEYFITLSPDGRYVTYVTADNTHSNDISLDEATLWLVEVATGNTIPLRFFPDNLWPTHLLWSPDSEKLAFVQVTSEESARQYGGLELWWVDIISGQASMLINGPVFTADIFYQDLPPNIQWDLDSDALSFTTYDIESATETIHTYSLISQDHTTLTRLLTTEKRRSLSPQATLPCPVIRYSQKDPRWSGIVMQTCGTTIGAEGCALTSAAMNLVYYGKDTDPKQLNQCLGNYACPLYWPFLASNCSSGKASFISDRTFSWSRLESELTQGHPVIVQSCKGSCSDNSHFYVVVEGSGTSASNYIINDPDDGQRKNLTAYTTGGWSIQSDGIRLLRGTPACDDTPPSTSLHITGIPGLNNWYHSTVTATLSATDDKSGVKLIQYNLDDAGWQTYTSTIGVSSEGQHTLYYKAQDNAGNWEAQKQATFGIDTTLPTTTLSLNHGATVTVQSTVAADQTAQDTGSGVWQTRFSNNGVYWGEWQDYADTLTWGLPAVDGATLAVYAQVRDYAGNESAVVSDTIMLDLTPLAPHSADFRLCAATLDAGGGVITATGYSLVASLGQPVAGEGGFLSNLTGCRPITDPLPLGYQLPQTVIASGGGLRSGGGFRLGDTAGQPLASGAQPMQGAGFQLSAGFWGRVAPMTDTCPIPIVVLSLTGPQNWPVNMPYTFTVFVIPFNATPPVTVTWSPEPFQGQGTIQPTYLWETPGAQTVAVQVENCGGVFTRTHTLTVTAAPPPTYTLAVHTVGSGTVDVTPDQTDYISGTEVTLTPRPANGWFFSSWSGHLSGTANPATLVVNANKSVTAIFEQVPPTCAKPLAGANIVVPGSDLYIGDLYTFQSLLTPTDATPPITYTWTPTPTNGQGPTALYRWDTPGPSIITLTVQNCGGSFTVQRTVTIYPRDGHFIYLPLTLRNQ